MTETKNQMTIRTGFAISRHGEAMLEEKISPEFKSVKVYSQADLKKLVPRNRIRFNSGGRAIFWRNTKVDMDENSQAIFVHYRFEPAYEFIDLPQPHPEKQISTFNILHTQDIGFYRDGSIRFSIFGFGRDYYPNQGIDYEEARFLFEEGRDKRRRLG